MFGIGIPEIVVFWILVALAVWLASTATAPDTTSPGPVPSPAVVVTFEMAMATWADWSPASDRGLGGPQRANSLTAKPSRQVTGGSPGCRVPA